MQLSGSMFPDLIRVRTFLKLISIFESFFIDSMIQRDTINFYIPKIMTSGGHDTMPVGSVRICHTPMNRQLISDIHFVLEVAFAGAKE